MLTSTARSLSLPAIQLYIFSFSGQGAGEAFELSLHRKFTFLSVRSSLVLSQFTAWCNHHHNRIWKQLHHSIKDPCTLSSHSPMVPPPVSSKHSAIFCLWICHFWTFHVSGTLQYLLSCVIFDSASCFWDPSVPVCSMHPSFPLIATQYSTVWIYHA